MAQQFDLETPDIALINFTQGFIQSLAPEQRTFLNSRDPRIKFASRLIEPPYQNYSPALQTQHFESFDIGSIYAFDNMILNVDRREEKPNMLFKNGRVLLIDHELTLAATSNAQQAVENNASWTHNYQRHLFHPVIRNMEAVDKTHCFDTFTEYLQNISDFNKLDFLVEKLDEFDHPVGSFFHIKSYLRTLKQNSSRFISLLNDTVT